MSEHEATTGQGPEQPDSVGDGSAEHLDPAGEGGLEPSGEAGAPLDQMTQGAQGATRRTVVDPATLLLAVERVGADVTSLGRALQAQPEEVAARLDIEAFSASISLRMGALGSALDQFRLALLAALDRSADRLDSPVWLPALQGALAERLTGAVEAADPGERLARLEMAVAELSDGVRAGAAVGDALDHLGDRLASIDEAAGRVAEDARTLVERVSPVPDRLTAIATQVDRITPLARAGDRAGTLLDQLDRVGTGLDEVLLLLRHQRGGAGDEQVGDDERFDGVIDVLAGVTRRQDQVTAAIASVLDQVRGPTGVSPALDRMEQRERSLAARLDRIDGELRRLNDANASANPYGQGTPDAIRLLDSVLDRIEQQEATVGHHLDWVGARLSEVAAHLVPDEAAAEEAGRLAEERLDAVVDRLDAVARRQDELSAGVTTLVEQGQSPAGIRDPLADLARQQYELAAEVSALVEQGQRPDGSLNPLAELARHQDELADSLSKLFDQVRGPVAVDAVFDRMEQRERSLAARLDRIDGELRRLGGAAAGGTVTGVGRSPSDSERAASSLEDSAETMATVAENLAALVESTGQRLERRLSKVESALEAAVAAPTPTLTGLPRPSASAEHAALRLAELRAERARVQAQLQEERLLAAGAWDDELGR